MVEKAIATTPRVRVNWVTALEATKTRCISGRTGRITWIVIGPRPAIRARTTTSLRLRGAAMR